MLTLDLYSQKAFEIQRTWTKLNQTLYLSYVGNTRLVAPDGSFYWLSCFCNEGNTGILYKIDTRTGNTIDYTGCTDKTNLLPSTFTLFQSNAPRKKDSTFGLLFIGYKSIIHALIIDMYNGNILKRYDQNLPIDYSGFVFDSKNNTFYIWKNEANAIYKLTIRDSIVLDSLILPGANSLMNISVDNNIITVLQNSTLKHYSSNFKMLDSSNMSYEINYGTRVLFSENGKYFFKYGYNLEGISSVDIYKVSTREKIKSIHAVQNISGMDYWLDIFHDKYCSYIDSSGMLTQYDIDNDTFKKFNAPFPVDIMNGVSYMLLDENDTYLCNNSFIYYGQKDSLQTISYNFYNINSGNHDGIRYSFDSKYFALIVGYEVHIIESATGNMVYIYKTSNSTALKVRDFEFSSSKNEFYVVQQTIYSVDSTYHFTYNFEKNQPLELTGKFKLPGSSYATLGLSGNDIVCNDNAYNLYCCDANTGMLKKKIGNYIGFRDYHFYNDSLLIGALGSNIATAFAFLNINTGKLNKIWNGDSAFYQVYGNINNSFSYVPRKFVAVLPFAADTASIAYIYQNGDRRRVPDSGNLRYKVNSINLLPDNQSNLVLTGYDNSLYYLDATEPGKISKIELEPLRGSMDTASYYNPALGWFAISPNSKYAVYSDNELTYGFNISFQTKVEDKLELAYETKLIESIITSNNIYVDSKNPLLIHTVKIYTLDGRLVKSIVPESYFIGHSPIFVGDLQSSTYLVQLITESGNHCGYFIKE